MKRSALEKHINSLQDKIDLVYTKFLDELPNDTSPEDVFNIVINASVKSSGQTVTFLSKIANVNIKQIGKEFRSMNKEYLEHMKNHSCKDCTNHAVKLGDIRDEDKESLAKIMQELAEKLLKSK